MARLELSTRIAASLEICFDLSRDLDLHLRSMTDSGEQIVAGRTSGLIELGEQVTWRAKHFGIHHEHTSLMTAFDRPRHFRDSMIAGRFARFDHDHFFEREGNVTVMRDVVEFEAPLGPLGRLAERLFLERYMVKLLEERNQVIKREGEATAAR